MLQVLPTPSPAETERDSDAAEIVSNVVQNVEELTTTVRGVSDERRPL